MTLGVPPRGNGKQWLNQERALLALGLFMLVLCAFAAHWLLGSAQNPPPHESNPREVFAAIVAALSWVAGWMLLAARNDDDVFEQGPDGIYRPVAAKRNSR
jgi:uncharacterized membrane protein